MSTPYIGQELYFWYSEAKRSEARVPTDSLPICTVALPTNEDKLEWVHMHYTHIASKPLIASQEYTFLGVGRHTRDGIQNIDNETHELLDSLYSDEDDLPEF